jgi:hypothetical protein
VENYLCWQLDDGYLWPPAIGFVIVNFYIVFQHGVLWPLLPLNFLLVVWSLRLGTQHLARQMLIEGADAIRQTTSWEVITEAFQTRFGMKLQLLSSYNNIKFLKKALLLRAAEVDKSRFGGRFRNVESIDIDCSSVNTSDPIDKQVDAILRRLQLQLE